jgi:16S rRNA (cytosine1402-N4)-methyltransferase
MDRANPLSAANLLNEETEANLQRIFSEYGEVRNAKTLSRAIVTKRKLKPIETTFELADIAQSVLPPKENIRKYMAPVFQAIRIAVNDELEGLKLFLEQCLECLKPGGKLVVITYHSLEDRIVKTFMQEGSFKGKLTADIYGNTTSAWQEVKKPLAPAKEEIETNPRARSAKLRIAEKRSHE